jgi:hypothetical protein
VTSLAQAAGDVYPLFAPSLVPPSPAPPSRELDAAGPAARGLWDDQADLVADLPDPVASLEAGRAALTEGDSPTAALHLALSLRLAPTLAPAILALLEGVDGPELTLVRGDAFRLVGHEREARVAFASVAAAIPDTQPIDKETT